MKNRFLKIAAILGMLAVILGAFGAHGLETKITPDRINTYEIGIRYHFYHTFAIFFVALLSTQAENKWLNWAGYAFLLGIICFSGSLYLLACRDWLGLTSWKWLGPLTPIGGVFFILGWAFILVSSFNSKE